MSDKLRSMQVFVVAASADSFAAAGQQLELSAVMVGKHVRALETQLGARLIERSTRKQALTDIGASYLERCREALASVEAADQVAESLRAAPQGSLRISAPVAYGVHCLTPVLSAYAATFPQVQIDLVLNDRVVDMAEEGIDIALRAGTLADTALVARALCATQVWAAASPGYLQQRGVPAHPTDLAQHNCLAFAAWGSQPRWRFSRGDESFTAPVVGGFTSNNGQALLGAAIGGLGVVVQADYVLRAAVANGQLTRLLPDWQLPERAMHIVRRAERRPSAKVRSFIDFTLMQLG
ncbi:DNA-binding transcriptional LysR family regulator [Rhodoferax ferrireducens]|uniref:DNA-binding transcriptional LysR family regulator n=1 Tax=Rhodoferax ferrireducens TaxID=192843 RepID=A0ABU2CE34_9BURK|nr:LysR substrate-binding domain-containing protein [Rhodoferax ferrireducens]MDR7379600.1 DNA-binding transcriptional LysR family regulator [Rhodoferax ferrireducens]